MQAAFKDENAIGYTRLYGDRKGFTASDVKEQWRVAHRNETPWEPTANELWQNWMESCLLPEPPVKDLFVQQDVLVCGYSSEIDKTFREKIKLLSTKSTGHRPIFMVVAGEEFSVKLEHEFNGLALRWYRETAMLSFIRQKAIHPCYQRIIGMGKDALPFIFRELNKGKGDWLWAIEAITRLEKSPVPAGFTFKQAVTIWLQWGIDNGYYTNNGA